MTIFLSIFPVDDDLIFIFVNGVNFIAAVGELNYIRELDFGLCDMYVDPMVLTSHHLDHHFEPEYLNPKYYG